MFRILENDRKRVAARSRIPSPSPDVTAEDEKTFSPELHAWFRNITTQEIPHWIRGECSPSHIVVLLRELVALAGSGPSLNPVTGEDAARLVHLAELCERSAPLESDERAAKLWHDDAAWLLALAARSRSAGLGRKLWWAWEDVSDRGGVHCDCPRFHEFGPQTLMELLAGRTPPNLTIWCQCGVEILVSPDADPIAEGRSAEPIDALAAQWIEKGSRRLADELNSILAGFAIEIRNKFPRAERIASINGRC